MSSEDKEMNLEKRVMSKITSGQIAMKPKWYFIIGSIFTIAGLVALSVLSVFFVNIILFLLRKHGPMGQWRLEEIINNLPWWIPVLAILGITFGTLMLKKYDFSYKKNYHLIIIGFIVAVVIAAFAVDRFGLNEALARQTVTKGFYQKIENSENFGLPKGTGKEKLQNGYGKGYNNRNR